MQLCRHQDRTRVHRRLHLPDPPQGVRHGARQGDVLQADRRVAVRMATTRGQQCHSVWSQRGQQCHSVWSQCGHYRVLRSPHITYILPG